jgi:DNA-binding transcriptional ArsR family regulator
VAAARGHVPTVSQVSLFCPVEAVALALGVHRCTVYRAVAELRAAGLVDVRGHFCTHRGRTRADGAVWAVRLRPVGGRAARVGYSDLKRQYRDLGGDIAAGRTVWAEMRQSKEQPSRAGVNLNQIRRWSLSPTPQVPVKVDCRMASRRSLEALLDVRHAPREARGAAVDLAAQALAQALSDRGSTDFYRKLLHAVLRRLDATGEDHSYSVYLAAQRAAVDVQEGFARRPGALFTSRLKRASWFDEVMRGPPTRVGGPVEA